MRVGFLSVILSAVFLACAMPIPARSEETAVTPQIELGGKFNRSRNIGMTKLMLPLFHPEGWLVFADIRGRLDDSDSQEYNAGLGVRRRLDDKIIGLYGFYDRLKSRNDNYFNQTTLGAEILTEDWDLRFNTYLPENKEVLMPSLSTVELSGSSIFVRDGLEKPLTGIDGEIGYRLPFDQVDLRVFAGGYYFDSDKLRQVAGPRGRVELTVDRGPLHFLPGGTELSFGGEFQRDDLRGQEIYGTFKVRIPFGPGASEKSGLPLKSLDRRMTRFVERDIDIVTAGAQGDRETALVDNIPVSTVKTLDANNDVDTEVASAGAGSLVQIDGSVGAVPSTDGMALNAGQVVVGGGTTLSVQGQHTGIVLSYTVPGTRPTIDYNGPGTAIFQMADRTSLRGVDMNGHDTTSGGVYLLNNSNVTVHDVNMTDAGGVVVDGASSHVAISNVAITSSSSDAFLIQVSGGSPNDVTITNATVTNAGGGGVYADTASNITVTNSTFTNSGGSGIFLNEISGVTVRNVTVDGAGFNGFELSGTLTGVSGNGNTITGTIASANCETSAMISSSGFFGIVGGGTCP